MKRGGCWSIHVHENAESPFAARVHYGDSHVRAGVHFGFDCASRDRRNLPKSCPYEEAPVPHGAKSVMRLCLWQLKRAGLRLCIAVETGDTGRAPSSAKSSSPLRHDCNEAPPDDVALLINTPRTVSLR
jgi:hypothetical protein